MPFNFTPAFTHGNLSPNFSNEDFVQALNDEYNNDTAYYERILPEPFKPSSPAVAALWPGGITFATWLLNQLPGCNSAGCSYNNPFSVPFSDQQKADLIKVFGPDCNTDAIANNYQTNRGPNVASQITYYKLASPDRSFSWENGSLCIRDRYNFEGIRDYGGTDILTLLVGMVLAFPGTGAITIVKPLLKILGGDYDGEPEDVYTWAQRGDRQIGLASVIFLKNCFTPQELCEHNKDLYTCALFSGKIPVVEDAFCVDTSTCIQVGNAQPSPILGLPSYAPNVMEIATDTGSWLFGNSDGYPAPFNSFSQQIVNANNYLGPYGKFGEISGRFIVIPSGAYSGELGFICQEWYDFNDGQYAKDNNGDLYPTKARWWETCIKSKVSARLLFFASRPLVEVEVAIESFSDNNSPDVFSSNYDILNAGSAAVTFGQIIASLPAATLTLI